MSITIYFMRKDDQRIFENEDIVIKEPPEEFENDYN